MSREPEILILHTTGTRRFDSGRRLYETIDEQFDETDVFLSKNSKETEKRIKSAEIVLASRFPPDLLVNASNLRWVQALSSGVDFYDLDSFESEGIILTNVAGIHAEPIAEQILGYMLVFERRLLTAMEQKNRSVWQRYDGGELNSKTIGIIGVGAAGTRVAELCNEMGMDVLGMKRTMEPVPEVDELFEAGDVFPILEKADYLLLSCPLTDETENLIGPEELKAMKSSSVLINISRGGVIEESALVETLQQTGIRGAALDVFEEEPLPETSPLWDLPNVIITPHTAGSSPHKHQRIASIFEKNYEQYINEEYDSMINRIV